MDKITFKLELIHREKDLVVFAIDATGLKLHGREDGCGKNGM